MKRQMPRFLDEPSESEPATTPVARQPDATRAAPVERPRLYEPLPDAPDAIGEDWRPDRVARAPKRFGAGWVAAAGIALVILGWLATTVTLAALSSYEISPWMGHVVVSAYALGGLLVLVAVGSEWRAMRAVRQVETVRAALRASSALTPSDIRGITARWLRTLPGRLEVDPMVLEAVQRAESGEEIVAVLKNRVAPALEAETRRIGLRVATEGSLLVAISPHQSWDGIIIALYGLRIVRQIAVAYGLRPTTMVTLVLLRRTLRMALEVAAVQIVAQGAGARLLESTPVLRHLAGTVPGLTTAELRLYRLAVVAGDACNPLADPG
ncbi:MAG: DUF697 domain-containing protein [Acetobacteraceae bacterium]|nr:DUF697 domain-containing protein [Pseudomonadota bacterium]